MSDRMKSAFESMVRGALPELDYSRTYIARVVTQSGNTIDVAPEDPDVPSMSGVPLFRGSPGEKVEMPPGGRVVVAFSGADARFPFAFAFDENTTATKVVFEALQAFLGGEVGAEPAVKGTAYRSAQLTLHLGPVGLAATLTSMAGLCTGLLTPLAVGFTAMATAISTFEAQAATFLATNARVK